MPLIILKTCIKSARLRLYSSVGKFNSCSLSLYDKCLRVEIIFLRENWFLAKSEYCLSYDVASELRIESYFLRFHGW